MMTLCTRRIENSHFLYDNGVVLKQSSSRLTSSSCRSLEDLFEAVSKLFPFSDDDERYWWHTTGVPFAQTLKRAFYPVHAQYNYLLFYYLIVLPEFGSTPFSLLPTKNTDREPTPLERTKTNLASSILLADSSASLCSGNQFQSYMTDDHSPIELSWQFDNEGGAVARFAIDPVRRQVEGDSRGAMGLFEDIASSNFLAPGCNLDWSRICVQHLTLPAAQRSQNTTNGVPEYPSQYFVGFDFSSLGIVMKAYFLPETLATLTSTPKSALITSCIIALSTPTPHCPNPPDVVTPWKRVLSFFSSLPSALAPSFNIVAVDCVASHRNRVKIYVRTPLATLANIRRFFTMGRDPSCTSTATQRALIHATLLWHLLFPALANPDCDDVEPPYPQHPTGGLLWYYELRPGHAEPFPKIYLPVRHWCSSDEQVVGVMEEFYTITGNFKAAERYGRDVRETYTHRPLSLRTGLHTYITLAVKQNDVEVTSYFNPECYAPERRWHF